MGLNVKIVLRTDKIETPEGFPIMARITIDRKIQYYSLKKYSPIELWNPDASEVKKKHKKCDDINLVIKTLYSDLEFFKISESKKQSSLTFESIKQCFNKSLGHEPNPYTVSLFSVFKYHIEKLKENESLGYAGIFESTLRSLKIFLKEKDYLFNKIDAALLRNYEDFLKSRECAVTTRSVYFRTFRTLWNIAIRDNHCPKDHYPFKDFDFSVYNNPRTKKRAITRSQINAIEEYTIDPQIDTLINSRNYFLFSFYCRGINFTDLAELKWTNIKNGELNYVRRKTKEEFNFKIHPGAQAILSYYKNLKANSDAGYIFPILYKRHETLASKRDRKNKVLKRVNSDIKKIGIAVGIEKKITTYVARHSFATHLLTRNISVEEIGKTLGHNDRKTTEIYLEDTDNEKFDDLINSKI
jgi:integrase/recombinase XerD